MATQDISRLLEQPRKHYSGARLQQGRLLLDADYNEGSELSEEDQRQAVLDLIGPKGSPDEGFSIGVALPRLPPPPDQTDPILPGDFLFEEDVQLNGVMTPVHAVSIRAGSFYLGGRRYVIEKPEHIAMQRDWLQMRPEDVPLSLDAEGRRRPFIVEQVIDGQFASGSLTLSLSVEPAESSPAVVVMVATRATSEAASVVDVLFDPSGTNQSPDKVTRHPLSEGTRFSEVSVHVFLSGTLPAAGGTFDVAVNPRAPADGQLIAHAFALRDVDPDVNALSGLSIERQAGVQIEGFLDNPGQLLISVIGSFDGGEPVPSDGSNQDSSLIVEGDLGFAVSHGFPDSDPERLAFDSGNKPWSVAALEVLSLQGTLQTDTVFRTLYFLHAWEQGVSAAEDEELLEAALGGTDTSTRVRRMRRVEMQGGLTATSCAASWLEVVAKLEQQESTYDFDTCELKSKGLLQLVPVNINDVGDCKDCLPDPAARFLGAENQTLRIMLTSANTFVWGFESPTRLFRAKITGLDTLGDDIVVTVTLLTPPADETEWPLTNRVIEIVPFGAIVEGEMPITAETPFFKKVAERVGVFTRVDRPFNPNDCTFTIDSGVGLDAIRDLVHEWDSRHSAGRELIFEQEGDERFFYVRMWHVAERREEVELHAAFAAALRGTNIQPLFWHPGRRGDFWIASLRPGTPDFGVPIDLMRRAGGVPPHGPHDFYTPLGLVIGDDVTERVINSTDCRPRIQPLSDNGCITVTVGDGVRSDGDFRTITEALAALPSTGGRIVVRPGTYRENVVFDAETTNVVLEGCGESTVIETPPPSPLQTQPVETDQDTGVIEIRGAQGITITSFRINAAGQSALLVADGASDIRLNGLSAVAGMRVGPNFQPGALSVARPLIVVSGSDTVDMRGLIAEPHGRPGLEVDTCQRVTLEDLTLAGPQTSPLAPISAMLQIRGSFLVAVRRSIVSTFGQVGIHVVGDVNMDIELDELSIISGAHVGSTKTSSSRSAVDIDGGQRVRLQRSSITMDQSQTEHAAVVVLGKSVQIVDNQLEVLAQCFESPSPSPPSPSQCPSLRVQAWGGIHVRGGASQIEIRGNRILGGVGHGITLGSLLYKQRATDPVTDRPDRAGAGRGQMFPRSDQHLAPTGFLSGAVTLPDGRSVTARDEGDLVGISIIDNRIEQMNGNGISVLSVFGMPGNNDLIEVLDLRIERNTILNNLLHPYDQINLRGEVLPFSTSTLGSGAPIPRLPHAGIALAAVVRADIRDNFIVDNGTSERLPINGIFVLCGDSICIANNRISGNGARAAAETTGRAGPILGIRAGIAVMLAGTSTRQLTTQLTSLMQSPLTAPLPVPVDDLALAVLNNSVRQPEGRALQVVAAGPIAVVGNFFSSEGNHGSDTAIENSSVGDVVYVQNLGAPWEQSRPLPPEALHDNADFETMRPPTGTYEYIDVPPSSPWFFVGEGGQTLFSNNQVVLDWQVLRIPRTGFTQPLALFPVALLSLDHLSVESNQFAQRLRSATTNQPPPTQAAGVNLGLKEPIMSQVFAFGASVAVGGNRCAEAVGDTTLSLFVAGRLMTLVTFNQTTHEIISTRGFKDAQTNIPHEDLILVQERFIQRGNQVMFSADYWRGIGVGIDTDAVVGFGQQFLKLVFDPLP